MSIRTKILGLTTAVALVAGGSLIAATPASAKTTVRGNTTITLDATVAGLLQQLGATISAAEGGKVKNGRLIFPVTRTGDGFIAHRGQLQIQTSTGTTVANNPMIEWPTDQPLVSAILEVDVPGIGATSLFTVSDIRQGKPKVKVDRKKKTRTSTSILRATLTVDAAQAGLLNLVLGTTLLTDGLVIGKTVTKVVTTAPCKNKKCTR